MNLLINKYPEIAKEYDKENNELNLAEIRFGSHKKVWWICSKNIKHKWQAIVKNRTKLGNGCPCCANQLAWEENNLEYCFTELCEEFDCTKNNVEPKNVLPFSGKKYWWKCKERHSWEAVCYSRTGKIKAGCPYCAGQLVSDTNNLKYKFPRIADEFDIEKNNINPELIVSGSKKKYWWKCKEGHSWRVSVGDRTRYDTYCPICVKSSKGELEIAKCLDNLSNIEYKQEFSYKDCKYKNVLRFDFYVEFNSTVFLIEYNGKQHYEENNFFKGTLEETQERDDIKIDYCINNNIPLLIIPYNEFKFIGIIIVEFIKKLNIY
jgi:hypothetical protein